MSWIKKLTEASFSLYAGNVVEAFQPLDFFHFFPLWYDLWIHEIVETMNNLELEKKHYGDICDVLPPPSSMRAILLKVLLSWRGVPNKNVEEYRRLTNFLARMLQEACPSDPFGKNSTPLHTSKDIGRILKQTPWRTGNPKNARIAGKLITAAGSLVHGLYNDFVTDFGWDAYGPYNVQVERKNRTLLIRHFPDLQPQALWSKKYLASVRELRIFALYENVEWKIACVGCHSVVVSGSPIDGLRKYAVVADNTALNEQQIQDLTIELASKAEALYKEIRKKDFEELKRMVMLQECYQMKKLFTVARKNWRPTKIMDKRIAGKRLLTGIVPHGKIMSTLEGYKKYFGIAEIAKEVLGEAI